MRCRRLLLIGMVSVVSAVAFGGCGETDEDTIPGPNMLDDVETEIVATVAIDDDGFSDDVVDVEPGQAIELTNEATDPLRVIGSSEGEQVYDTGEMLPAESTIIVFDSVGRFSFEIQDGDAEPLRVAAGLGPTPATEEPPATEAGNR